LPLWATAALVTTCAMLKRTAPDQPVWPDSKPGLVSRLALKEVLNPKQKIRQTSARLLILTAARKRLNESVITGEYTGNFELLNLGISFVIRRLQF
jgi:hypothetical protein